MDDQLTRKYIRTKNKVREIVTYKDDSTLREYHKKVVAFIYKYTTPSLFAKAYTPRSSIYKNALAHMYNDIFVIMDIKDFFHSINHSKLSKCLYYEISKNKRISYKECCEVVRKCSVGNKGLPLGLISSPVLANLYLKEFDGLLYGYIKRLGLQNPIYTRYADDLVISFAYKEDDSCELITNEILDMTDQMLRRYNLRLNGHKTKVINLNVSNHVRITGISITKSNNNYRRLSVGRKMKNEIFWKAISINDNNHNDEHDQSDIAKLKGLYSFILSIEKNGIDSYLSSDMKQMISDRGFGNLNDLISSL